MSKPKTLLEELCRHALSRGADSLEVEYEDRHEHVYARGGDLSISIASFPSSGGEARELRENLLAARKKPVRVAIDGRVWILKVSVYDSFGEDAYRVKFVPAPPMDFSDPPAFTKEQGQYLAFIHYYTKIHRQAPAETDFLRFFRTTPPSVHQMILTLELAGFIARTPGAARSIRLLVPPEKLPSLE